MDWVVFTDVCEGMRVSSLSLKKNSKAKREDIIKEVKRALCLPPHLHQVYLSSVFSGNHGNFWLRHGNEAINFRESPIHPLLPLLENARISFHSLGLQFHSPEQQGNGQWLKDATSSQDFHVFGAAIIAAGALIESPIASALPLSLFPPSIEQCIAKECDSGFALSYLQVEDAFCPLYPRYANHCERELRSLMKHAWQPSSAKGKAACRVLYIHPNPDVSHHPHCLVLKLMKSEKDISLIQKACPKSWKIRGNEIWPPYPVFVLLSSSGDLHDSLEEKFYHLLKERFHLVTNKMLQNGIVNLSSRVGCDRDGTILEVVQKQSVLPVSKMEHLDLSYNALDMHFDFPELADAMKNFSSLTSLNLSGNGVGGPKFQKALVGWLEDLPLLKVNLSDTPQAEESDWLVHLDNSLVTRIVQ